MYNRVQMEIDLNKVAKNIKIIRNKVNNSTKIMAIVKADAYGHGAIEISKVAIQNGADWLGVAICEEGLELRDNGIDTPILILGYTPEAKMSDAIDNDLTQTIYSYEIAKKLSDIAKLKGKTVAIHIKIDTGMSRLGYISSQEAIEEIKKINQLENIKITGIYTHLATSDDIDKTFAKTQCSKFLEFENMLLEEGIGTGVKHISNSGAVLNLEEFNFDIVRTGIIIYGLYPSQHVDIGLEPAMSLKTHISLVKEVSEAVSVSYARTYFTKSKTKIAVVPVGYADGYSRSLSNKGRVLVNGEYANIIGNICMDQFMIDVTHIPNVKIDDEVILLGEQNGKLITAEEIAELQGTINHEIICSIGKRVPRVYK